MLSCTFGQPKIALSLVRVPFSINTGGDFWSNINLNLALVENGLAWHFKKYSKDETYAATEIAARSRKIGLWSDPKPVPPWEWKK